MCFLECPRECFPWGAVSFPKKRCLFGLLSAQSNTKQNRGTCTKSHWLRNPITALGATGLVGPMGSSREGSRGTLLSLIVAGTVGHGRRWQFSLSGRQV